MSTTIKPRRSDTPGNAPSIVDGELSIQRADKRILMANSTAIFDAFQNTVSNIAITSSTGKYTVGNTTANVIINSTSMSVSVNTTVQFIFAAPSAADYAAATKFLAANGSWLTPAGGGGGGSPGGANTQVQFNDSGSFAGNANFTYDKSANTLNLSGNLVTNADFITIGNSTVNNVINSTSFAFGNSTVNSVINTTALYLPVVNPPLANIGVPASGVALYGYSRAGLNKMSTIAPDGWTMPLDSHAMHQSVYMLIPNAGATTFTTIRCTNTVTSTPALVTRTPTAANVFLGACRVGMNTATTIANISVITMTGPLFQRGSTALLGGFYLVTKFGAVAKGANSCVFVGLTANTTATLVSNATIGALSAQTNIIGFGWANAQANYCFVSANATTATIVDTGMTANVFNTNWMEGVIYCPPNGGNVQWQLTNITSGTTVNGTVTQVNVPSNTTLLQFRTWAGTRDTAAAACLDFGGVQIECLQ